MSEVENREGPETRRLVLGFDAGCVSCGDLARRIEEQVGDKLEVRSLHDPQVEEWRRRALGDDAPWAPTLFEIKATEIRAWTSWQMGLNLSRFLGPVATWRVLQVLGEVGAVPEANESPTRAAVNNLTRGQFLKGVGGGLVALSIIPAAGAFASSKASSAPLEAAVVSGKPQILRNSEVIKKLKRFKSVRTAANSFGKPNWNHVYRGQYKTRKGGKERTLFMIPFQQAKKGNPEKLRTNFLMTEDETRIRDAQSTVMWLRQLRDERDDDRAARDKNGKKLAATWHFTDGRPIATIPFENGNESVESGAANRVSASQIDGDSADDSQYGIDEFVTCFNNATFDQATNQACSESFLSCGEGLLSLLDGDLASLTRCVGVANCLFTVGSNAVTAIRDCGFLLQQPF